MEYRRGLRDDLVAHAQQRRGEVAVCAISCIDRPDDAPSFERTNAYICFVRLMRVSCRTHLVILGRVGGVRILDARLLEREADRLGPALIPSASSAAGSRRAGMPA